MTLPLLSPGGKRKMEKEERDCRTLAQAVKKAEDKRKAKEEQGKQDAERARRKKEQEKQKKEKEEKEQKERENQEKAAKMVDGDDSEAAHKTAMKKAKDDLVAAEKARLTQLELTNPCLFDNKLKFVVTKLLYTNLYEKDNPYCNLFELQNIQSWEGFLAMYQANPLSVYTN